MGSLSFLGISSWRRSVTGRDYTEHVTVQRPLRRVLAFTRRSIDDVVNDPIAKNEVLGYYKLHKWVERGCEVADMERWWNSGDAP